MRANASARASARARRRDALKHSVVNYSYHSSIDPTPIRIYRSLFPLLSSTHFPRISPSPLSPASPLRPSSPAVLGILLPSIEWSWSHDSRQSHPSSLAASTPRSPWEKASSRSSACDDDWKNVCVVSRGLSNRARHTKAKRHKTRKSKCRTRFWSRCSFDAIGTSTRHDASTTTLCDFLSLSSSEEEEEEEEDISVYLRVVVCKAKSMYVRTLLYERAFSNWKNVGDVFKRSRQK